MLPTTMPLTGDKKVITKLHVFTVIKWYLLQAVHVAVNLESAYFSSISLSNFCLASSMSPSTSSFDRLKFSILKA